MPVGTAHPGEAARGHPIPVWAQVVGAVLLLAFLALSVEAYAGPGLRSRVMGVLATTPSAPQTVPERVFYEPGASVRIGQKGVGSEGQDRVIQEGDAVLLGATGQLVRVGPGGRASAIPGTDGATTRIANLGAWNRDADRLAGATARFQGGRWTVDRPQLQSVGADLHPARAPGEALTDGFWLGPDPDVGRVRRVGERDHPALRIRASRKAPALTLETREPLPALDGVLVSVTAVVRGQPGKRIVLALEDTVDAAGNTETVTEPRAANEEWTHPTVRKRVVFPSQNDRITVSLLDVEAGDWIEVGDFAVVLGVAP